MQRLMDYLKTNSKAYLCFYASHMVLRVDSDAAYLVMPKVKSRVTGYFYLSEIGARAKAFSFLFLVLVFFSSFSLITYRL